MSPQQQDPGETKLEERKRRAVQQYLVGDRNCGAILCEYAARVPSFSGAKFTCAS